MIVFPAAAALVSAIFAVQLFAQYARRKRLPELAWGIAMTMYAIASLAVAAGVSGGFDPTLYRLYWVFGALLNVPYLALGSVALLGRRPVTVVVLLGVLAATIIAFVAVGSSPVHLEGSPKQIPRGSSAWGKGTFVAKLPTYLSIPAYVIAVGATIVATGGPLARYGRGAAFSVTLAVGVMVMFLGFRLASRSPGGSVPTEP